jgi:hypothetical protein
LPSGLIRHPSRGFCDPVLKTPVLCDVLPTFCNGRGSPVEKRVSELFDDTGERSAVDRHRIDSSSNCLRAVSRLSADMASVGFGGLERPSDPGVM